MSPPPTTTASVMERLNMTPDPWQRQVLQGKQRRLLLNCCRQAGKSTVVAAYALQRAMETDDLLVLVVSPSLRQSTELFRVLRRFHDRLANAAPLRQTAQELVLANGSRIVSLPCNEETIRGFSCVGLLIIDEAARVPDDLYLAVRPMLAVSGGQLICMSTPWGKRGFFYEAWQSGGDDWQRIRVPAQDVPRIKPEFLAQERRTMRLAAFQQEYECSFEAMEGLVYPDFGQCVIAALPEELARVAEAAFTLRIWRNSPDAPASNIATDYGLKCLGGLDFGYRNPFAAVWGLLDREGVLWVIGEHYGREQPLSEHARHLPRRVIWYADPAGANERAELICAGFTVRKGDNALAAGIAAVAARIQTGRLKVLASACPNLIAEAALYRYDVGNQSETPVDEHNHALAALRYLISRIDARKMVQGPVHLP